MTSPASVGGDDRLRLFCGLCLPDVVLDALEQWQRQHLRERIVPRTNLHVTLAFLGSRPRAELDSIARALDEAAGRAEPPVLRTLRYRETRSVGMLLLEDEHEHAGRFASDLHDRLEALGVYRREEREWLPHVTVTRFRERPRLRPPLPDLGAFSPSDAAVYHSALRPGGAQYRVLESVALGG